MEDAVFGRKISVSSFSSLAQLNTARSVIAPLQLSDRVAGSNDYVYWLYTHIKLD